MQNSDTVKRYAFKKAQLIKAIRFDDKNSSPLDIGELVNELSTDDVLIGVDYAKPDSPVLNIYLDKVISANVGDFVIFRDGMMPSVCDERKFEENFLEVIESA